MANDPTTAEMKQTKCVICGENRYKIHRANQKHQKDKVTPRIPCANGRNTHKYRENAMYTRKLSTQMWRNSKAGEDFDEPQKAHCFAFVGRHAIHVDEFDSTTGAIEVTVHKQYDATFLVEYKGKRYLAEKKDVQFIPEEQA
jgi:hypothetical protein